MSLRNILIAVKDLERSKRFYQDVFGLRVIRDFGENAILSEGLVLQSLGAWEQGLGEQVAIGNASELFFEEHNLDDFLLSFKENNDGTLLKDIHENPFGKRCVLILDPDGHLVEVAER